MGVFKALSVITQVGIGAGVGLIKGVGSTAVDACKVVDRAVHQDWEGSLDIVGQRIERTVYGVGSALQSTVELIEDLESDRDFLRQENVNKMTQVASLGLAVGLGSNLFSDNGADTYEGTDAVAMSDTEQLTDTQMAANFGLPAQAIDNGMFIGNEADLQALIEAGQDPEAVHVDAEDIHRNMSVRNEFLAMHGYDSVPEGYEVHHVQPLSEGGPDTVENMILIDEASHDQITAAHQNYYQWRA